MSLGTAEQGGLVHRIDIITRGLDTARTACGHYIPIKQMHNKEHVVTCLWCIADREV